MIGLSLSLCIKDVIEGRMAFRDVDCIVTNTCAYSDGTWDTLIQRYRRDYWSAKPDLAEYYVRQLLRENLIVQPRTIKSDYYRDISKGHWV